MRIVIGCRAFGPIGGTQSYTLTLAEHLERLGHDAVVATELQGEMAELARSRGVRVVSTSQVRRGDAVVAQDAASAYELAHLLPSATRVYVAHSTEFAGQLPPQVPGVVSAILVMNDRLEAWCQGLSHGPEVVRLHQPVDLERFGRLGSASPALRRVVVFGNQQGGASWRTIEAACADLGARAVLVGRHGTTTTTPEAALADADVVIGIGRCAVEGLAARRAVYVSGIVGTDGWVTLDSYPRLEADGFSGRATGGTLDGQRLRRDLAAYSPTMGERGRDLAYRNHDATRHASSVAALLGRLAAEPPPPGAPLDELARMVRVQTQLEDRAAVFSGRAYAAETEARRSRDELAPTQAELSRVMASVAAIKASRRYRAAGSLAAVLSPLRALLALLGSSRPLSRVRKAASPTGGDTERNI